MKRTLSQSRRPQNSGSANGVNENELNSEQKKQLEQLKGMAKKYEGKSENDILRDLNDAVARGKKDGSMSNEKMESIAKTIAPMLNREQKNKLDKLMKSLK